MVKGYFTSGGICVVRRNEWPAGSSSTWYSPVAGKAARIEMIADPALLDDMRIELLGRQASP